MINRLNKIAVLILTAAMLAGILTPLAVTNASATFNNDSSDKPTLRVSNYTKNPGSSTSWATSVSADAGDIISFDIYYHNTSSETATQTKTRVSLPSSNFTAANIAGYVWADNASRVSGSAYISLSSSQTLTFIPGSVSWYPNQSTTSQSLSNGQDGSQVVTSSGLNIGDITAGWSTQGHVVFRAQVSNMSAPSINGVSSSNISSSGATLNASVNPNSASTNVWFQYGTSAGNFSYSTSSQSIGTSSTSVTSNISGLSSNTTYYFRAVASNSQGTTYGSTLSFTTSSSSSTSAPSVTTNSATSISTSTATLNGTINPNGASTTAWFEYGTSSSSLTYATSTQSLGSGTSSTSVTSNISGLSSNTTYYFRAVASNSQGTTYGSILSFTTQTSGTTTSAPSVTTNSATGISANGATLSGNINPNNASTTAWFEYGTSSTSLTYATGTQSLGSGTSVQSISANISSLNSNTTYYFRAVASNSQGTTYGSTLSFDTSSSGGSGGGGSSSSSSSSYYTSPIVITDSAASITSNSASFSGSINPNGLSATGWFEYGTSSSSLSNKTNTQSMGSGLTSSSIGATVSGLSANTTYYFRAAAQNGYGTAYGNTLSFTTSATQTNTSAPSVTTNAATAIASTSANLNATVNPNGSTTTVSFEYGTSSSSLNKTSSSYNISGSSYLPVTIGISGLLANTTYYFRPVATNSAGTTYGAVNSFIASSTTATTTKTATTATTTTITKTTTSNTSTTKPYIDIANGLSVANLTSPNGNGAINFASVGDKLKYTIIVKNTGGVSASNIKVSNQFSSALRYIESSPKADFDSVANVVSWNISKINSGESALLSFTVEIIGGLDTIINNQMKAYLSFADLNIYSNTVSTYVVKENPASLKLAVDKEEVKVGNVLNYSLTIKNPNNYGFNNFLLSIGLPENVELQDADFTTFNKSDKSLIVDLGSIAADQEITKKFSVKVLDQAKDGDILTVVAIANYQDAAGNAQPIVSVSVSSAVNGSLNLAASIFGGLGSFSLTDWLIIFAALISVLAVSFAGRKIYKRYKTVKVRIQQQ